MGVELPIALHSASTEFLGKTTPLMGRGGEKNVVQLVKQEVA